MDFNLNSGTEEKEMNSKSEKVTFKDFAKSLPGKIKNLPSDIVYKIRHFDKEEFKKDCVKTLESLQVNGKTLFGTVVAAVILMFAVCWIVFFATVRRPEQVMVPDVVGKDLTNALLEMQAKELYAKIQLRFSDDPDSAGLILNQKPDAGAIVKAGRRVVLTVGRGVILDHVESYVGKNYEDVKDSIQTMFAGSKNPLLVLAEPNYKSDKTPAGTILAQDPAEGTEVSDPVTINLIVSSGPEIERTRVPNLKGMTIESVQKTIENTKLVFDFSVVSENGSATEAAVVSQNVNPSDFVENYTRVGVELEFPKKVPENKAYGVFATTLPSYPYGVDMSLQIIGADGRDETAVYFKHNGGSVTIPYFATKGCEIVLSVKGKKIVTGRVE